MRPLLPKLLLSTLALAMVQGCFHAQLNGSVGGAEITVTELDNSAVVVARTTSTSKSSLKQKPGKEVWNSWSSFAQLALQGVFLLEPEVGPDELYLVTASGGDDADTDLDRKRDKAATAVTGEWRAIMTGTQLMTRDLKVSVLTEAVYQSVAADIDGLSDDQVLQRLDRAATKVIGDENGDGAVNYLDVLQWSRLKDKGELRADLGDLNRLALAIREGQEENSLQSLGNRVLDGPAGVDQDDLDVVKVAGDGTCEGRARTVQVGDGENTTTVPPSSACGSDDTGSVESTQDTTAGVAIPASNGFIRTLRLQGISLEDLTYDQAGGEIRFTVKESGKEPRSLALEIESADQLDKMSNVYRRILAAVGSNSTPGLSLPTPQYRQVFTGSSSSGDTATSSGVGATNADLEAAFADVLSYGALASNWSACLAYRYFAAEQAAGRSVPEEALGWAVKGCTSQLVEVETFVEESTEGELEAFEEAVPEVELEGCSDCYSSIVIPATDQLVATGTTVRFEGIAPQSARQVRWAFGDGGVDEGLSAMHRYNSPGQYTAELRVEYSDGSSDVKTVRITVERPSNECFRLPEVDAGANRVVDASTSVVLSGTATTFAPPGCSLAAYRWEQIGSGPSVSIAGASSDRMTFEAPAVAAETQLDFSLSVEDSDGGVGEDTVTVTVLPLAACSRGPDVSASHAAVGEEMYMLAYEAQAYGPACDIVAGEWQQLLGGDDPEVVINYDESNGYYVFSSTGLGIQTETDLRFRVTVRDTDGNTANRTITVPVTPGIQLNCSQDPQVTASASRLGSDVYLLDFDAQAFGASCIIVDHDWRQVVGNGDPQVSLQTNPATGKPSFSGDGLEIGTELRFRVTVTDSDGTAASDVVDVTIEGPPPASCDQPPTVAASSGPAPEGYAAIALEETSSAFGSDCNIDTVDWEQVGGSPGVDLVDEGIYFGFDIPELATDTTLTFKVTVTDTAGQSTSDTVNVPLTANAPVDIFPKLYYFPIPGTLELVATGGEYQSNTSCQILLERWYLLYADGTLKITGNDWGVDKAEDDYGLETCYAVPGEWGPNTRTLVPGQSLSLPSGNFQKTFDWSGGDILSVTIAAGGVVRSGVTTTFTPNAPGRHDLQATCEGEQCALPPN